MAIIVCDGFEQYGQQSDLFRIFPTNASDMAITVLDDDTPYERGKSLEFGVASGIHSGLSIDLPGVITTIGMSFHLKVKQLPQADWDRGIVEFWLAGSGAQVSLGLNQDGTLRFNRSDTDNTSSVLTIFTLPPLPLNQWVHMEIRLTAANQGAIEIRVNGNVVGKNQSIDTQDENSPGVDQLRIGVQRSTSSIPAGIIAFDNLVIWDDSGTMNNDFLGEVEVATLFPSADDDITDWTPSEGSDGYAMINEDVPDDDDTYIESDVEGAVAQFELDDLPDENMRVLAVQTFALARKDDSGERGIQVGVESDEAVAEDDPFMLGPSYMYTTSLHEVDPATDLPWEKSAVNAMKIRAKVV